MTLKNGMIIKCNSKEDAQEFIKEAHKQGFKWVNYHEGDEEKTCWGYVCDFNSEIYYHLEADEITWSSMYSGNESIEYSTLKEKIKTMTKSDLKNGMVVETRLGKRGLVVGENILFDIEFCSLEMYDDDLKNYEIGVEESYTIDVVYSANSLAIKNIFDDKNLETLWIREIENNSEISKEKEYFRLDITEYKEYIKTMCTIKGLSITKYIRNLIKKDKEEHENVYLELLKLKGDR